VQHDRDEGIDQDREHARADQGGRGGREHHAVFLADIG
jgi:hypothetical protein